MAICTQLLLLREKLQSCSASKYAFTPLQRYAFCSFPLGLPEHAVEMCDDKMHVSFPAGPNLSELINFDATISICLQYYRMSTGLDVGETGIIKEKFALGLQSTKGGVTFMDSETSESLLQSGADGEEFGLFCFAEENDEIC